jgi:predicted dehydrogenase
LNKALPLRAAVIGTGLIGSLHARFYKDHPLSDLRAVCDVDAGSVQALAKELGVAAYTDHREMVESVDLDFVSIATPEQHRFEPAVACAEKNLALMLEKPLAPTLSEADRLITALDERSAYAAVNFILRADPRFATVLAQVRSGALGQVATYSARRRGSRLGIEKYAPWTDLLISTAIHDIDMMLALNLAPPSRVFAEGVVRQCEPYGCEDAVMGVLRFEDGTIGSVETSWALPPGFPEPLDPAFHVVADHGGAFIDGASHGLKLLTEEVYVHPDMAHWPLLPTGVGGALASSLNQFVKRLFAGEEPLASLEEARNAQEVVAAMKLSIETGRPVDLPLDSNEA